MTPFQAYKRYLALRAHFTQKKYNAIQYNFQFKAHKSTFDKRNDKSYFYKLANHPDLDGFLISLLIRQPEIYIGDIVKGFNDASHVYLQWQKRISRLKYQFIEECSTLDLQSAFKVVNISHPELLTKVLREEISPETFTILADITNAFEYWDKKLKGDVIYEHYQLRFKKYKSFLKYDRKEYLKLLKDIMNESK